MGLWDFVKNAGKALGIGEAEAAEAPSAEALKKEVEDLGLKTEGLEVEVEGDTVKVNGKAPSQAEKEKVILAVGNVAGVAKVEEAMETPSRRPSRCSTRSSRATRSGRSRRDTWARARATRRYSRRTGRC